MEQVRWSPLALDNLADRKIDRQVAQQTLVEPRFYKTSQVAKYLIGSGAMRIIFFDPEADSLTITLRQERIKESDEVRPGVIADFGYDGGLVRLEILQASKVIENAREIQFAIND
jgi:uncharacterized protein YuzE